MRATRSCWSILTTSKRFQVAKRTPKRAKGWPICFVMACFKPVLSLLSPSERIRTWTCSRKTRVQERAQEVNRLQKALEGAKSTGAAVATDILGNSGRELLEALVMGEQDADTLAELARGKRRAKRPPWRQALAGRVRPSHRFLIQRMLAPRDL